MQIIGTIAEIQGESSSDLHCGRLELAPYCNSHLAYYSDRWRVSQTLIERFIDMHYHTNHLPAVSTGRT